MHSPLANDNIVSIPAWLQPRVVRDTITARGGKNASLLRHTSLFPEDFEVGHRCISVRQFERLLDNAWELNPHPELPFLIGHEVFRQALGPLSALTHGATPLPQMLDAIHNYWPLLSPSVAISLRRSRRGAYVLIFNGATRETVEHRQLEVTLTTTIRLLLSARDTLSPVEFFLPYRQPDYLEQYEVNLPGRLHFSAPLAALRVHPVGIPQPHLETTVELQCASAAGPARPLLALLRSYICEQTGCRTTLRDCADWLGISEATLKRRLAEQSTSYQRILDQCQCQNAIFELLFNEASIESLCRQLRYRDTSNFRRAFKRWTGFTPANLRETYRSAISGAGA